MVAETQGRESQESLYYPGDHELVPLPFWTCYFLLCNVRLVDFGEVLVEAPQSTLWLSQRIQVGDSITEVMALGSIP